MPIVKTIGFASIGGWTDTTGDAFLRACCEAMTAYFRKYPHSENLTFMINPSTLTESGFNEVSMLFAFPVFGDRNIPKGHVAFGERDKQSNNAKDAKDETKQP